MPRAWPTPTNHLHKGEVFTYTPLVLLEGVEHVETMYKYNCCADTVLIAERKKMGDFQYLSSASTPSLTYMEIHHHGSGDTHARWYSHIQFLPYIEDKTGSLLPVAEFLLRVNAICATGSVLKLFFCEQPPPPVCHFRDVHRQTDRFLRHVTRGRHWCGAEHAQ